MCLLQTLFYLRSLDVYQIIHPIYMKKFYMMFFATNYNKVKNKNTNLNFEHFSISLSRALCLKEIHIV